MGFLTPSYDLSDLFSRVDRGDIQLPDFQREYSWDEDHIRSLLVTILRGYPMGALMVLDTRNEPVRFRARPLSGAPATGVEPGLLLLDGQQRLSSLYRSLRGDGFVRTRDFRGQEVRRCFFVDITKAHSELLPDDAVFAVGPEGNVLSHFGPAVEGNLLERETAVRHNCLPVASLLEDEGTSMLFDCIARTHVHGNEELRESIVAFHQNVLRPLAGYRTPVIRLARETAQAGIGSIFAAANSAGLQMDVFDLLTAVFAHEDENFVLAQHWEGVQAALRKHPALDGIGRNEFLSAVALLVTGEAGHAGGQREDILNLSLADYVEAVPRVVHGFEAAAQFLAQRCIISVEQVPYTAQLLPLAVILALLQQGENEPDFDEDRLNRWFWCGVFGELYGSQAVKLRSARDVNEVPTWLRGQTDEVPHTIREAAFCASRLLSAENNEAIAHAFYALLMARGAKDWRTGKGFNGESVAVLQPGFHHVYPLQWCQRHGVDPQWAESVLNRTPMGKRTEVVTDGNSPRRYLARVQSKSLMGHEDFEAVVASHDIDPTTLTSGDPADFFNDRLERFIGIVEYAMDAEVIRDVDRVACSRAQEIDV